MVPTLQTVGPEQANDSGLNLSNRPVTGVLVIFAFNSV